MATLTPTPRRRRSGCGRALWGQSRCRSLQGRRCLLLIGYVGAVKRPATDVDDVHARHVGDGCLPERIAGPPKDPHPRGGGPLDLSGHRRPHPTASRPPARRGSATTLGETRPAGPPDPGPGPPRLLRTSARPPPSRPERRTQPTRPGRRLGSHNRQPAPRYDVGKTVKRDMTITAHQKRSG
jgi:hypothetical protein